MAANLSDGQKQQIVDYLQKAGMTPEQAIKILQESRGELAAVMVDALHDELRKQLLVNYLRSEDDSEDEPKTRGPITLVPIGLTEDYSMSVENLTGGDLYRFREPRALKILCAIQERKRAEGVRSEGRSYLMEKLKKRSLLPEILEDHRSRGLETANPWAVASLGLKYPRFRQDRTIVGAGELEEGDGVVVIKNMAENSRFLGTMASKDAFPAGTSFLTRIMKAAA